MDGITISNLSNEVLIKIFEDVRGGFDVLRNDYPTFGINDIKNLRLVCKRFHDANSHLLFERLDVSLTIRSLNNLEEVSRHPTISQYIRTIRVTLYNSALPKSFPDFITQVVQILRRGHDEDCTSMEGSLARIRIYPDSPHEQDETNLSTYITDLKKRCKFLLLCTKFLRGEELRPDDDRNMTTLCQLYRQRRQLIDEQDAIIKCDIFITCFAKAVARMPNTNGLSITERTDFEQLRAFFNEYGVPVHWRSTRESGEVPPHPRQALELLLAFVRGGNSLVNLRICLDPSREHQLRPSEKDTGYILKAARYLEILDIDCQMGMQSFRTTAQSSKPFSLSGLGCLFAKSKNLRSITLNFNSWARDEHAKRHSAEPLLATLPWDNLREISLTCAFIHYHELIQHIEKLSPTTHLYFEEVCLISGVWVDLLDALRQKADCTSSVVWMKGKEDERRGHAFRYKDEDWQEKWEEDAENPASAYIRGQISENPLRSLSVPDSTDTD